MWSNTLIPSKLLIELQQNVNIAVDLENMTKAEPFNRTTVECKSITLVNNSHMICPFNRTTVECKYIQNNCTEAAAYHF